MNIDQTIKELVKSGVSNLNVGQPPKGDAALFVQAEQWVPTGTPGNNMRITHQTAGDDLSSCLEQLKKQVASANQQKVESPIVLPRNRQ